MSRGKRVKVEVNDHRLRASTWEEVGTRVAAAVYALSAQHIQHCLYHTLKGETQMKEAEEGHARREREGTQVAIPKTKKRKKPEKKNSTAPPGEVASAAGQPCAA